MADDDFTKESVSFEERQQYTGLATSALAMLVYLAISITRAFTDDLPLTEVAWQGPMLWVVLIAGGVWGIGYAIARKRYRGIAKDSRDTEIERYGESMSGGPRQLHGARVDHPARTQRRPLLGGSQLVFRQLVRVLRRRGIQSRRLP